MEFTLLDLDHSVGDIERLAGYRLLRFKGNEFELVRNVGQNDYLRFNLLVKILNGGDRGHYFDLSMENSSRSRNAISKGFLVEKEIERIKESLMKIQE